MMVIKDLAKVLGPGRRMGVCGGGGLQYDGTEHSRQITKEMQNYVDEKSISAVLEQIHVKTPIDQRKLWETVGDEIKVDVSGKKVAYCILGTHTVQEH